MVAAGMNPMGLKRGIDKAVAVLVEGLVKQSKKTRSSAEIAGALHLAEGTVRNYLSEAISKLGASNRVDAARIARSKGFL